jgi:large subunit ribosomal protein L4
MVYLDVYNDEGCINSKISISDIVFDRKFNRTLVHQIINSCVANSKVGTKSQKTRAEVRGGGVKPWKQKSTGRARAGSIRSPLWRSGGKIFAAKPIYCKDKVNKKMYKISMCCVLSELLRQGRFYGVDEFYFSTPKTKELGNRIMKFPGKKKLFITTNCCTNVYKSSLNIIDATFIDITQLTILDLLKFDTVGVFITAIPKLIVMVTI